MEANPNGIVIKCQGQAAQFKLRKNVRCKGSIALCERVSLQECRVVQQKLKAAREGWKGKGFWHEIAFARTGAEADRKELAGADAALAAAKTGNDMVSLGKLYFSTGDYGKAADAIQKGLAKGGVTDADDANTLLGIALARAAKPAEAVTAFQAIKDPRLAELGRLWQLAIQTPPAAAPAATEEPATTGGS